MEESVAQVAPPVFIHHALPGRFCEGPSLAKKRNLPWQNPNFMQQQQHQRFNSGFQNTKDNWNPKVWAWDSVKFVAEPSEAAAPCLGTEGMVPYEQKNKSQESIKPKFTKNCVDGDGENLSLKLGGSLYSDEVPVGKPNKRVRSGSPGAGTYPMCQVDDCRGDLSNAKDYHRRHKVCELHSKTTKALVGKQMQRFCQQCSRFHPLSEFDEGKRSCRRRLAGHNRRRRKTQTEDVSSRLLLPGNREGANCENMDIVNLLTVLACLRGNSVEKGTNDPSIPDKERLIEILSKINPLPVAGNSTERSPISESFDLNVSQQACSEHQNKMEGNTAIPSTMDLLAVLSAALAASSPDTLARLSQRSSQRIEDGKSKLKCVERNGDSIMQNNPVPGSLQAGQERCNNICQSSVEVSDCRVQEAHQSLPLQLFSSSPDDDSPPKLASTRRYFSSDSSNPIEESSPSSSPPFVQKLFPLQSSVETMKNERVSISGEDTVTVEASTTCGWSPPLELFKWPNERKENDSIQNVPNSGYTSSSGSDHSPSSLNLNKRGRTGRVMFKLFDKDPSDFPGTLRTQIFDWLSHSPLEMESYIRPGCVVLSVYLYMPSSAWEKLQEDLLQYVRLLTQDSDSDFWRNGRFLVQTGRRLASYKDGKIRLCKSWRTWTAPELIYVSPLAIVSGQETSLLLRGRNLNVPGTRIHCTYMGGYSSKEISGSEYKETMYDCTNLEGFSFPGGDSNVLGRCFIEVENGFKGNSFPLIIADATICQELRILESEFEEGAKVDNIILEDQNHDFGLPKSREDVLHFLNELGWLFQRKSSSCRPGGHDFSQARFKFLFTFAVERDWCALVKILLDIFVEIYSENDGLSKESLEALSEIHLLNKAVKRKCKKMVDVVINYSLISRGNASRKYLFPPSLPGPGGVTPLHLAACLSDSEDIVNALTSDPLEIGLQCWKSLLDASGQSPYNYASMRNNHSYNMLVLQKLADRKCGQVSITVGNEVSLDRSWVVTEDAERPISQSMEVSKCCARCADVASKYYRRIPAQGLLHRPYVHSMLAIAAVCVCVCLFLRGSPDIGAVAPFKWENLGYGFD